MYGIYFDLMLSQLCILFSVTMGTILEVSRRLIFRTRWFRCGRVATFELMNNLVEDNTTTSRNM